MRRLQSFGLRLGFWDLHNLAGLKEARKSPPKLTLKGPESPTCTAVAEGPAGQSPGFRSGLHSPPLSPGSRQSQSRSWGLRIPELRVRRGLFPQTLKHAVSKARRAWASPSGGHRLGRLPCSAASPPLPVSSSWLLLRWRSTRCPAPLAQRLSQPRSFALGPFSDHVTLLQPPCPNFRTPLGTQQSNTPEGLGAGGLVRGPLVATRVPSVRSGRCARPGPGSPALPALNEPLARSIVAPQGSIRQNWTTMWRLPLARGDSRRSDWPGPRPGSPSFYSVRKIRNSARSAECLRDGRGRQGRSARGGALQMS